MNRSNKEKETDRNIMIALLTPQKSMYELKQTLEKSEKKSNYATTYRHIKKMQKNGLVKTIQNNLRKNGKPDNRKGEIIELTSKGLATLLIKGDLQKAELITVVTNIFRRKEFNDKSIVRLLQIMKPCLDDTISSMFMKMKPKVNLEFFDEKYFDKLITDSFAESMIETLPKIFIKGNIDELLNEKDALKEILERNYGKEMSQAFEEMFEVGKMLGLKNKEK